MSSEIRDASNSITLHFDIRAQHLSNKRLQSAKRDNQQFILGCAGHSVSSSWKIEAKNGFFSHSTDRSQPDSQELH
jgi:hypothetical protein